MSFAVSPKLLKHGVSSALSGKVSARRPLGFALPLIREAAASPQASPHKYICRIAFTSSLNGKTTGAPLNVISATFLVTARIFLSSSTCSGGKSKVFLSKPSPSYASVKPQKKSTGMLFAAAVFARFKASSIRGAFSF